VVGMFSSVETYSVELCGGASNRSICGSFSFALSDDLI